VDRLAAPLAASFFFFSFFPLVSPCPAFLCSPVHTEDAVLCRAVMCCVVCLVSHARARYLALGRSSARIKVARSPPQQQQQQS
jgi:hypothetical protein